MVFGGEGFPKNKLKEIYSMWNDSKTFSNVYGPTECTCICSSYLIRDCDFDSTKMSELAPLGRIIDNIDYHILDESMNEVEDGEVGQLCLSGSHLSSGYYNDNKLTDLNFVYSDLIPGITRKIYLTGDLVVRDKSTKLLHFKGRADTQIKFMGYRIELAEIEDHFSSLASVNECCALFGPISNSMQIVLCLSSSLEQRELIDFAKQKMPYYMVPRKIFFMRLFPKTQTEKSIGNLSEKYLRC